VRLAVSSSTAPAVQLLPRLGCTTSRLRIRPGERPTWIAVPDAPWEQWRADAQQHAVPLDGLVTARLEVAMVCQELRCRVPSVESLHDDGHVVRLAPTSQLRDWVRVLQGRSDQEQRDECPEIVVPARLAGQLDGRCLTTLVGMVRSDEALMFEQAAAQRGATIATLLAAAHRDPCMCGPRS